MSLKLNGSVSPNLLIAGVIAGAGVYVLWKISGLANKMPGGSDYVAESTFRENVDKAPMFSPLWWMNNAYEAVPYVNPASDQNLAYQGANKIVQALPGASNDETLGTWLYGIFNKE